MIKIVGDSFDWNTIPTINIDNAYFDTPDSIKVYAQIESGTDGLKVHLWTTEPERRAEETEPVGSPCEDSCLEFFFAPMGTDKRYFNVEFNSNGCIFLGFGSCVDDLVRLMLHDNTSPLIPEIHKDDKGWEIFYTFPFEFIRRFFPEFEVYEGKENSQTAINALTSVSSLTILRGELSSEIPLHSIAQSVLGK